MKYAFCLLLICSLTTVFAQHLGNLKYSQDTPEEREAHAELKDGEMTLTISGLLNARADTFVAFFNITQVGETAEKTDSLMVMRIARFKAALRRQNRDTLFVHTDMISLVPKYELRMFKKIFSKTYNEVPDGFELQKNVSVRYHNTTDLDAIVTAAAQAEIYDLVKVDYFLIDVKKQYEQLRARCQEAMKARVKYFEGLGMRLDTLRKIFDEDFATVLPQTRYGSYVAVSRPSLSAMRKEEEQSGKIYRADPPASRYYQAVSYANYDVVINPVVAEPVVQLSYQVSLKYFLPMAEPGQKLLLITPGVQVQEVEGL